MGKRNLGVGWYVGSVSGEAVAEGGRPVAPAPELTRDGGGVGGFVKLPIPPELRPAAAPDWEGGCVVVVVVATIEDASACVGGCVVAATNEDARTANAATKTAANTAKRVILTILLLHFFPFPLRP